MKDYLHNVEHIFFASYYIYSLDMLLYVLV